MNNQTTPVKEEIEKLANDYDGKNYQIVAPLKLLQQKFAQHLGVPDLDTTDAYAVEWTVKELSGTNIVGANSIENTPPK